MGRIGGKVKKMNALGRFVDIVWRVYGALHMIASNFSFISCCERRECGDLALGRVWKSLIQL